MGPPLGKNLDIILGVEAAAFRRAKRNRESNKKRTTFYGKSVAGGAPKCARLELKLDRNKNAAQPKKLSNDDNNADEWRAENVGNSDSSKFLRASLSLKLEQICDPNRIGNSSLFRYWSITVSQHIPFSELPDGESLLSVISPKHTHMFFNHRFEMFSVIRSMPKKK